MSTTEIIDQYDENGPIEGVDETASLAAETQVTEEEAELLELQNKSNTRAPDPIGAGMTQRKSRMAEARAIFKSQILHDDPEISDDELVNLLEERMKAFQKQPESVLKFFDLLTPTCLSAPKDDVFELVELAAIRRVGCFAKVEQALKLSEWGRPATHGVTVSSLEKCAMGSNPPEIKKIAHDFFGDDGLLDWAFDEPYHPKGPQNPNSVRKALHPILARTNSELLIECNIKAIKQLHELNKKGRTARYCSIDGTAVPANVLQKQTYSPEQTQKVNRKTKARYYQHDAKKKWRGYVLLTIVCQKTSLPLVWHLTNEKPAAKHVQIMLDKLFKYWPGCPMKYLAGDAEFDFTEYYDLLYKNYSIQGVFAARNDNGEEFNKKYENGVPRCCDTKAARGNGHDGLMTQMPGRGPEGFMTPEKRAKLGIARGDEIDYKNERIRWECRHCGAKTTTRPKDNPRRFVLLPFAGDTKLAALRQALMLRRNTSECMFSVLKLRGVGLVGTQKAKWVQTMDEMSWLLGMTFVGMTVGRLAHADGTYEAALNDARRRIKTQATIKYQRPMLFREVAA